MKYAVIPAVLTLKIWLK